MLVVASGGLMVNIIAARLLHAGASHSLNVRGAYLHVISDLLGSVAVIVAALAIRYRGWMIADPVASIIMTALIVRGSWQLVRESVDVLLEAAPAHIDLDGRSAIAQAVPGVASVHDLHVWTVTSGMVAMSAHVVSPDPAQHQESLERICAAMAPFGIGHVTVQIEGTALSDCEPEHRSTRSPRVTVHAASPRSALFTGPYPYPHPASHPIPSSAMAPTRQAARRHDPEARRSSSCETKTSPARPEGRASRHSPHQGAQRTAGGGTPQGNRAPAGRPQSRPEVAREVPVHQRRGRLPRAGDAAGRQVALPADGGRQGRVRAPHRDVPGGGHGNAVGGGRRAPAQERRSCRAETRPRRRCRWRSCSACSSRSAGRTCTSASASRRSSARVAR